MCIFQEKDGYGNEVTQIARPLPVEYLLLDMPAAFPVEPVHTFHAGTHKPFPLDNREDVGEAQVGHLIANTGVTVDLKLLKLMVDVFKITGYKLICRLLCQDVLSRSSKFIKETYTITFNTLVNTLANFLVFYNF